ncbi:MAG TPA: adenosylcobinamide amidohydrolase [Baekduia sp.]|uniref:adenosylcobinamide amidohydrolase n=1 Tax=Baekduia sp. TaxID=2600305 RepID=UPI002B996389|nr:adenosylcobinamide amidohydrolase [Baekduia sp.]HMJ33421.1 adenosylcobinamide amidohydrolase [Baekduia sp.]
MSQALVVDFGGPRRCLSSAVVGGGLRTARAWLNLQVGHGYARTDPDVHLCEEMLARGLDVATTLGAMTAAHVDRATEHAEGGTRAVATVGIGVPLAAAGRLVRALPKVNTINIVVLTDAPLTDSGLVYAVQTATEAKAQALADAGIGARNHAGPATGTATDSIAIAALPGECEPFAGPMAPAGAAIAHCVHAAVLAGALAFRQGQQDERQSAVVGEDAAGAGRP